MSSVKQNQSVRNACRLMELIADAQPIGVSELARRANLDKSAVHRLAVTLGGAGWLRQSADGRWQVAPTVGPVVARASVSSLVELARPLLHQLRDETSETAMLVTIEQGRLTVRDLADSPHALRITAPVGSELPIRNSSALRAIAAHAGDDELELLRRVDPGLDDVSLARTRAHGWAINDGEITADTRVVGSAILSSAGRPVGAFIVCAPASRVSRRTLEAHGELVAPPPSTSATRRRPRPTSHGSDRSSPLFRVDVTHRMLREGHPFGSRSRAVRRAC